VFLYAAVCFFPAFRATRREPLDEERKRESLRPGSGAGD